MSPHWDTWEFNLSPVEIPHCDTWEFEFSAGEAEAEAAEAEILAPHAQPKQGPKPSNSTGIAREVMSRSPDDRKRFRELAEEDSRELPWDIRGPLGPKDGGPQLWKGQRYRANTGRWANSGGRNKEKYAMYRTKKIEGLVGNALHFWHPMSKDGYWAKKAAKKGIMAPWEEKEAGV